MSESSVHVPGIGPRETGPADLEEATAKDWRAFGTPGHAAASAEWEATVAGRIAALDHEIANRDKDPVSEPGPGGQDREAGQ